MQHQILCAGFGGQGILFAGKLLAYVGLLMEKETSWLPSYGPEMRGGTANCGVIISDEPVGSPIVLNPDVLLVMNLPSFDKFEKTVKPHGKIIVDSTLIHKKCARADVDTFYVPATGLADENGLPKFANVILIGKLIKETGICDLKLMEEVIKKNVPSSKPALFDLNMKAFSLGYDF
jgi:2-oxoglutarate ferredoxin oxidoreductase subunit gamma